MTDQIHLIHALDELAGPAIPLDVAKDMFAEAVADAAVRGHALGQQAGYRRAVEDYDIELAALRASGRELCETVAVQLRAVARNMTSEPFDGSVEIARLADTLDSEERP